MKKYIPILFCALLLTGCQKQTIISSDNNVSNNQIVSNQNLTKSIIKNNNIVNINPVDNKAVVNNNLNKSE